MRERTSHNTDCENTTLPFVLLFRHTTRYNLECAYSEATGRGAKRKAADDAAVSDAPIPKPATVTSEVAQHILERCVQARTLHFRLPRKAKAIP